MSNRMRKLPTCGICKETIPFDQKTYSMPEIGVYHACEKCYAQFMDFKKVMECDKEMKSWFDTSSLMSGIRISSLSMTIICGVGMAVSGIILEWTSAVSILFGIVTFICCVLFILASKKQREVKRQQPMMELRFRQHLEDLYERKANHGNG